MSYRFENYVALPTSLLHIARCCLALRHADRRSIIGVAMSLLGNYNFIILGSLSPGDAGSRRKSFHRFDHKDKRLTCRFISLHVHALARGHARARAPNWPDDESEILFLDRPPSSLLYNRSTVLSICWFSQLWSFHRGHIKTILDNFLPSLLSSARFTRIDTRFRRIPRPSI